MECNLKPNPLSKGTMVVISQDPNSGQTLYCCVQCPEKYIEKDRMELHLYMHNKEYRFLCGICGTGLKRREHLDRHILGHQEVRPHVCQVCGKAFKRKEHLSIHLTIHSGQKSQICPLCQRSFYRKDHLQKHMQTHSSIFRDQEMYPVSGTELLHLKQEIIDEDDGQNGEGDLDMEANDPLEDGNIYSDGNITINAFADSINQDNLRPFLCLVCGKGFKKKFHLKLHMQKHTKRVNVCSECGEAFHKEEELLQHMNTHLNAYSMVQENVESMEGEYIPDNEPDAVDPGDLLIPRVVYKQEEIKMGVQWVQEKRAHECEVCGKRFKRKQHLKVHGNVHRNQQPQVWCSVCGQGFLSNNHFENHKCIDENGGEQEVSNNFQEPANIISLDAKKENHYPHIAPESGNKVGVYIQPLAAEEQHIPVPVRVFVCKYCEKPFKRKDHYKIHLHVHTGIKSFFCTECGKGFYRKDHLHKHMTVHNKPNKPKKLPALLPLHSLPKKTIAVTQVKPEITIHAPSNSKLRVPLQIKVPYQMVMEMDNGEQRAVTINPRDGYRTHEVLS